MALSAAAFAALQPKAYHEKFLSEGLRSDGRSFVEQRSVSLQYDYVSAAHGSATASIGGNCVVVAVRGIVTVPQERAPTEGVVEFTTSLTPLASGANMPDSTPDESFALAELLQKIFVRGKIVNLDSLCIAEGKAVWSLKVDVVATSVDGSLLDAVVLAAGAALKRTQLPSVVLGPTGKVHIAPPADVVAREALEVIPPALSVAAPPLCFTFARIANNWLLDPTNEEQSVTDSMVQVAVRFPAEAGAAPSVCLLHSAGDSTCSFEDLQSRAEVACELGTTLVAQLKE